MSEQAPLGVYVYQPHSPQTRKDGRLWQVGGIPLGLTKEEAEAIVEAINEIGWLMDECHACGHELRFPSSACPQCGADAIASWVTPPPIPKAKRCQCARCARPAGA